MGAVFAEAFFQEQKTRPHMRDIEQARMRACPKVLWLHALKLHWHFVSREGDHFAAELYVQSVKWRCAQRLIVSHMRHLQSNARPEGPVAIAPAVSVPERFRRVFRRRSW